MHLIFSLGIFRGKETNRKNPTTLRREREKQQTPRKWTIPASTQGAVICLQSSSGKESTSTTCIQWYVRHQYDNMTWQDNTTMTIQQHVVCQTDKHIDHCHSPFQVAFCNGTGSIANRLISSWTSCSKTGFLSQGKVPCQKHKMICVRVNNILKLREVWMNLENLMNLELFTISSKSIPEYLWFFSIPIPREVRNPFSNLNAGPSTLRQTPASLFSSPRHQKLKKPVVFN